MTTKAFTSALGYGVTIRGYIDEDDRLVLLEPEGSGGGGGIEEAKLTVAVTSSPPLLVDGTAFINKSTHAEQEYLDLAELTEAGEYDIVVPQKIQFLYDPESQAVQVTGDATSEDVPIQGYSEIYITGAATITVTGK